MDRLNAMEVFVRVVDTGSFSAAAAQMRIGQPAVSKSMAQLEDRLGVRLLLRNSRAFAVTEAGRDFYVRARQVVEDAREAEVAARGAGARLSGRLRFSAAVTFARLHVVPRLPAFMALHPDLAVYAVLDDRPINPVEEGLDVAFRLGGLADSALVARKISRSRRMTFGSPSYFERAGFPDTPEDLLAKAAIIYTGAGGGSAWTFRRAGAEVAISFREHIVMSAAEGVREAVLAGLGFAVASEWMFQPELATGQVIAVLPEWTLSPVDLWAIFPTGRLASAKARAFADFVERQLNGGIG